MDDIGGTILEADQHMIFPWQEIVHPFQHVIPYPENALIASIRGKAYLLFLEQLSKEPFDILMRPPSLWRYRRGKVLLEHGQVAGVDICGIAVVKESGIAQEVCLYSTQEGRRIFGKVYPLGLSNIFLMPFEQCSSVFIDVNIGRHILRQLRGNMVDITVTISRALKV